MNAPPEPSVESSRWSSGRSTLFLIGLGIVLILATVLAAFDLVRALWGLGGFGDARLETLSLASLLLLVILLTPACRTVGRFFLAGPLPARGIRPFLVGLAAVPLF